MSDIPKFAILDGDYAKLITHLRSEFITISDRTIDIAVTGTFGELTLRFRANDQYLIGLNGIQIRDANQHYSKLPAPNILTYSQISDALFCGQPPLTMTNRKRLRILAFITSEAARFHVIARNVGQLIKEKNDSSAMDFKEADFIIKNYDKARIVAGLPKPRFEPLMDTHVHIARSREFIDGQTVTHMDKNLQRTDVLNALLKPKIR